MSSKTWFVSFSGLCAVPFMTSDICFCGYFLQDLSLGYIMLELKQRIYISAHFITSYERTLIKLD